MCISYVCSKRRAPSMLKTPWPCLQEKVGASPIRIHPANLAVTTQADVMRRHPQHDESLRSGSLNLKLVQSTRSTTFSGGTASLSQRTPQTKVVMSRELTCPTKDYMFALEALHSQC